MLSRPAFRGFVALDEQDAPDLLQRMTSADLSLDGERYGIESRLIARPGVQVIDLAVRVLHKLCERTACPPQQLGAVVLSSRIFEVQAAAAEVVRRMQIAAQPIGIERACSGFPAATALAVELAGQRRQPIAVLTAEILSININWEPSDGSPADHPRARGQAAKLFADGAAAALIVPGGDARDHEILDAWAGEVPDDKQLIQKLEVQDSVDPWGAVRPGITSCMSMPGRRGFLLLKRAPVIMAEAIATSLTGLASGSQPPIGLSHVVPHQANGLIIERLQQLLDESHAGDAAVKVWNCIAHAGNTVSASIPTAMAVVQERLPPGVLVAMPSVGAGGPGYRPDVLSNGCVLVRFGKDRCTR